MNLEQKSRSYYPCDLNLGVPHTPAGVPTSLRMLTDLLQPRTTVIPLWNSKTNITSERITHWSPFTSSCNPVLQAQSSSSLGGEASTVNLSPSAPSPHTFTAVSAYLLTYCVLAPSCSHKSPEAGDLTQHPCPSACT